MKTVIAKKTIYQIVFILCVVIPYFDNYELTIAVWSLATLFSLQNNYSYTIIKQLFCFTAILGIASVVSFFEDHQLYYVIRDLTYLIKPILGILIGYQLCKKIETNIFELIVHTAFVFALVHFFFIIKGIIFFRIININMLRFYGGYFSDFEVFALIIILFRKKFEIMITSKRNTVYFLVIGASVFFYLARTNFIQLGILFLALKGFFVVNKRNATILATLVILILVGYSTVLLINPKRNGPGMEAFLYKIKIIPQEALKTKIDRDNWKDLNDNYRSYENIMTIKQMNHGGNETIFFGKGLGSKIDLKEEMQLGDTTLRFISILHNGYMTVFLKSGLLGICFLLLSFGIYFKRKESTLPIITQIDFLMVGMGVFMIMSYWVFMGFYFKADNKAILLGILICYREIVLAKQKLASKND